MKKIAIFASHNGSIFDCLYQYTKNSNDTISLIISNNSDAKVFQKAIKNSIAYHTVNNKLYTNPDQRIIELLEEHQCNFVILAGYMKKISPQLANKYTIINSHPALLPNYGGKGMYGRYVHEAVIHNKETQSGVTIHYVNEHYDEGGIILQKSLPLDKNETIQTLETKIKQLEKIALIEALKLV